MTIAENLNKIKGQIPENVTLVAVSKRHPSSVIIEAIEAGHLDFGENQVQELCKKQESLPSSIRWHMIGHLQSNKVKYIAPFVHLIHGVDSLKLLKEINKRAAQNNRVIQCLLQIHIAQEETKFGLSVAEMNEILGGEAIKNMKNVKICGLMGMATNTEDEKKVRREFADLKTTFEGLQSSATPSNCDFKILSMGMSGDYMLAIKEGSTMIRVGSAIFGPRTY